jgi:hypothetical protein
VGVFPLFAVGKWSFAWWSCNKVTNKVTKQRAVGLNGQIGRVTASGPSSKPCLGS